MHFAFVIFKYFRFGGIQRDMLKMARAAQAAGHQVTVFTLRWEADPEPDLEVRVLPIEGMSRHTQYERFAETLNDLLWREPFDLVVGFNKIPGLDVYYAGDSSYIEKSLTQRSALYRQLPRFKSFFAAERAVFHAHSPTQILTISGNEVPGYRHHYQTQPERFHPLPPGIERDRVAPPDKSPYRQRIRALLGLENDEHLLLFVGSGFIKKGLDRVLLGIASLPPDLRQRTRLVVIGRDKVDAFARLAMRLGITEQVTFFAEGRDDVPDFLFAADALVHPAYDETAGMVLVEAIVAGLPVLTTANCGYASFVAKHAAGIVMPGPFSQAEFDQHLVELITSDQRATWISNGLHAAQTDDLFSLVPQALQHFERVARARRPVLVFTCFAMRGDSAQTQLRLQILAAAEAAGYEVVVYCFEWQLPQPSGLRIIQVTADTFMRSRMQRALRQKLASDARWWRPRAIVGFDAIPGIGVFLDRLSAPDATTGWMPAAWQARRWRQALQKDPAVHWVEDVPSVATDCELKVESQAQAYLQAVLKHSLP